MTQPIPEQFATQRILISVVDTDGKAHCAIDFEAYETKNRDRFWGFAIETLEQLGRWKAYAVLIVTTGRKHKRVYEIANTIACGNASPVEATPAS